MGVALGWYRARRWRSRDSGFSRAPCAMAIGGWALGANRLPRFARKDTDENYLCASVDKRMAYRDLIAPWRHCVRQKENAPVCVTGAFGGVGDYILVPQVFAVTRRDGIGSLYEVDELGAVAAEVMAASALGELQHGVVGHGLREGRVP